MGVRLAGLTGLTVYDRRAVRHRVVVKSPRAPNKVEIDFSDSVESLPLHHLQHLACIPGWTGTHHAGSLNAWKPP